jgi:hypothetical protein
LSGTLSKSEDDLKRLILAALAATGLMTGAYAQSNAMGPLATPSGALQFTRAERDFVGTLNNEVFDRFTANALKHFDDTGSAGDTVTRAVVQTDAGPVLYDFRQQPPLVLRTDRRMSVERVFWQGDEVVMQGSQGWFRFKGGVLTKLQSSKSIYH